MLMSRTAWATLLMLPATFAATCGDTDNAGADYVCTAGFYASANDATTCGDGSVTCDDATCCTAWTTGDCPCQSFRTCTRVDGTATADSTCWVDCKAAQTTSVAHGTTTITNADGTTTNGGATTTRINDGSTINAGPDGGISGGMNALLYCVNGGAIGGLGTVMDPGTCDPSAPCIAGTTVLAIPDVAGTGAAAGTSTPGRNAGSCTCTCPAGVSGPNCQNVNTWTSAVADDDAAFACPTTPGTAASTVTRAATCESSGTGWAFTANIPDGYDWLRAAAGDAQPDADCDASTLAATTDKACAAVPDLCTSFAAGACTGTAEAAAADATCATEVCDASDFGDASTSCCIASTAPAACSTTSTQDFGFGVGTTPDCSVCRTTDGGGQACSGMYALTDLTGTCAGTVCTADDFTGTDPNAQGWDANNPDNFPLRHGNCCKDNTPAPAPADSAASVTAVTAVITAVAAAAMI